MLRADELLYFIAEKTYTSTYSWVKPSPFNSTISPDHSSWFDTHQSEHGPLNTDLNLGQQIMLPSMPKKAIDGMISGYRGRATTGPQLHTQSEGRACKEF